MTSNCLSTRARTSSSFITRNYLQGLILLVLALVACFPQVAAAQSAASASGSGYPLQTPRQVFDGTATVVAHYSSTQKLRLTLALQPPHMAEEEQFLRDLQTKGSPEYHHFLSPAEWTARFDPSEQDEKAVVDWAQAQGLSVTHRFPNRLLVDVEAPAATIENAFHVIINSYQLGTKSFFSNDRDPQVAPSLAGIVHSIQGLNNLQRMYPADSHLTEPASPDYAPGPVYAEGGSQHAAGSRTKLKEALKIRHGQHSTPSVNFTNGFLDPTDIYGSNAYDYTALSNQGHCCNPLGNPGSSPPESSIAIATFGDQIHSDIGGFHNQYPYLAYNVNWLFIDGTPGCCDAEGTLDTEWSTATANSFGAVSDTAHVWIYEGANFNNSTFTDMYNFMLTDGHAKVFTTSWSCTEFYGCDSGTMDSRHNIFNSMLGQGWTLMTASGDRGATDDCSHLSVAYPASDPDLIGVGGTFLQLFSDSTYDYEVAWTGGTGAGSCGGNNGGSGGGCSSKYAAPGYQTNQFCGASSRSVPDISLNSAYGQNYYFNGSLRGTGGTSIASPELAGFFAQENAYLLSLGNICGVNNGTLPCAPIGQANYPIYYEGLNPTYAPHFPFYDITSGCNSNDITAANSTGYYCAGSGYDAVTGWGTANMLQLAWALNWSTAADQGAPFITFSGPATNTWYNSDQIVSWSVTDTGGNFPPTGVAGMSQGWDFDPGDVSREPTPGQGNSFYSGPQYPNAAAGCLDFTGGSCAGGVSQGCHTANVRAWDNMGITSGDYTYGPVCYDTIPPTTTETQSPAANGFGWNRTSVQVTLHPSDPGAGASGSGVLVTYYNVDGGSYAAYSVPFTLTTQAAHTVIYQSEDVAGNFQFLQSVSVRIDETAPNTAATLSGTKSGTTYITPVGVTLTATDNLSGVAATTYQINAGAVHTYSGPFTVAAAGAYQVTFHSTDLAGNAEATKSVSFTIKGETTTTLSSSPRPSQFRQAVTFTAQVTSPVTGTMTGSVTFKNGTAILGTVPINTSHIATITVATLTVGSHSITASYAGNASFLGSTSAVLTQTVNKANTTTAIASSLNPSHHGNAVTFTATVTGAFGGSATGKVTFKEGPTILGTGAVSTTTHKATFTTSTLSVGTHSIKASYAGDGNFRSSVSAALSQVVKP